MKQRVTMCFSIPRTILRAVLVTTIIAYISSVNANDTSPGSDEEGSRGGITASRSGGRSGGRFGGLRNMLDELPMELEMSHIRKEISSGKTETPVTADTNEDDDSGDSSPRSDAAESPRSAHEENDDDKNDDKESQPHEDNDHDKDDDKNDDKESQPHEKNDHEKDDDKNADKESQPHEENDHDIDDDKNDDKESQPHEENDDDKDDDKKDDKESQPHEENDDDKDDDKKDDKDDEKIDDKDDDSDDKEKDQVVKGGDSGDEDKNDSPHDDGVPATKHDDQHDSADGNPRSSESEDHTPPAENTKKQPEKFFKYHIVKDSSNKNNLMPLDDGMNAEQDLTEDQNVFYVTFACQPIIGIYVCKLQCAKRGTEMVGTCETGYCHCILRKEKKLRKEIHKRLVAAMEGFDTDCSDPKKAKQCKRFCKGLTPDKEYTGLCTDKRCHCVTNPSEAETKKNPCKKAIKKLKKMEEQTLKILGVKPESGTAEQQVSVTDEDIKRFSSLETLEGCTEDDIQTLRSIVGNLSQGFNLAKPSEGTQNPILPKDLSGSSTSASSPEKPTKGHSGSVFWKLKSWFST